MTLTRTRLLACLGSMLVFAAVAHAQLDGDLLAKDRWHELSQGMSLRTPIGGTLQSNTDDGALLRVDGPGGYAVRVFVKQSKVALASAETDADAGNPRRVKGVRKPIDNIIDIAQKEMALSHPSEHLRTQYRVVGGKDGAISYYRIRNKEHGDRIVAQVFVVLDERTFALLQLDVDEPHYSEANRVFTAVVNSVQFASQAELIERRTQWTQDALNWHHTISPARLHAAIQPEQLFRITYAKQTIGWMRVTQQVVKSWDHTAGDPNIENNDPRRRARAPRHVESPGVGVIVQARLYVPGLSLKLFRRDEPQQQGVVATAAATAAKPLEERPFVLDMDGRYYVSDDRTQELWSNRISMRPFTVKAAAPGARPEVGTEADLVAAGWADTGIRDGDAITVSLETPNGVKYYEWPKPPAEVTGLEKVEQDGKLIERIVNKPGYLYLSQVELWMLPQLLPRDQAGAFGFYTYRGPNVMFIPGVNVHAANVAGAMSFGLVEFGPASDGSFTVKERPTLTSTEYMAVYDSAGRLLQRQLPEGLEIVETTREELATLRTRFK